MPTKRKPSPRPRHDRGQGRPPLPEPERRSVAVQVLLTPEEAAQTDRLGRVLAPGLERVPPRAHVIRSVLLERIAAMPAEEGS